MFAQAPLTERLVRARLVVPADPRSDGPTRRREAREQVLPVAFFFKVRKKRSILVFCSDA